MPIVFSESGTENKKISRIEKQKINLRLPLKQCVVFTCKNFRPTQCYEMNAPFLFFSESERIMRFYVSKK